MSSRERERRLMVDRDLRRRGIHDPRVLAAMEAVPREEFLPPALAPRAYEDAALPIEGGQTISQPFIVAAMVEALQLGPQDRVLEIGAGSGYAAAVLAHVAGEVYTVERIRALADLAQERIRRLGLANVHVLRADGSLGWPEHAPYDAIVAAAAGPDIPPTLLGQLAVGGVLVMPVGRDLESQELVRVRRIDEIHFERERLGGVRFVPLLGEEGFPEPEASDGTPPRSGTVRRPRIVTSPRSDHLVAELVAESSHAFGSVEEMELEPLLDRIGDCRVVLLGEATHGTSEFYTARARITRALVERRGFRIVAVEADWPDAAHLDRHVRGLPMREAPAPPFSRFPTWMWCNRETRDLIEWMREHNGRIGDPDRKVSFHGLDLYSLYTSAHEVLRCLDRVDPDAARITRERYGTLTPWLDDPALYGRAVLTRAYRACEDEVVAVLTDLLARRMEYSARDGTDYRDAAQNARVVVNAERYYRVMYHGSRASWNLRDRHMFDTLTELLAARGPEARAVVWEHNSHVGDAAATEMGRRGELNVGMLARERFGDDAFLVGFGTDHGDVAAASEWDGPTQRKVVRPGLPGSYEALFHRVRSEAFLLPLRQPLREEVRDELAPERLQRAIGVVYRPETERQSHYFLTSLPRQFDAFVWFDRTEAVTPVSREHMPGLRDVPVPEARAP